MGSWVQEGRNKRIEKQQEIQTGKSSFLGNNFIPVII
jgi:hypothetical protein